MNLSDAIKLVEGAKIPRNLFGSDPPKKYRELAKLLHPDKTDGNARAAAAFQKLSKMYAELNGKAALPSARIIGKWIIEEPLLKGDICDLYLAHGQNESKSPGSAVFKIASNEVDNDLLESEYAHLKMLHAEKRSDNWKRYLPRVLDTLDASGRRANVLTKPEDVIALSDLLLFFPGGIDFKHVVWFGNRALSALWFAHEVGIVHGAVLPEHLMFGPKSHGLCLVDWCYSTTLESKKHIPAVVGRHTKFYPPEVKRKRPATPAFDIYMLGAVLKASAADIPKRFHKCFEWMMADSPNARPGDAWEARKRWIQLAEEEFGPKRYIELKIPVKA